MRIDFELKSETRRPQICDETVKSTGALYYRAYFGEVEISVGSNSYRFPNVPMLYFVTALQDLLIDSFLTRDRAETHLWDTGLRMSLTILDGTVFVEMPNGGTQFHAPAPEFLTALKTVSIKLLWAMYDDDPKLLSVRGLFADGSFLQRAAQLPPRRGRTSSRISELLRVFIHETQKDQYWDAEWQHRKNGMRY